MVFSSVPVYLDPHNWQQVRFSSNFIHTLLNPKRKKKKTKLKRYKLFLFFIDLFLNIPDIYFFLYGSQLHMCLLFCCSNQIIIINKEVMTVLKTHSFFHHWLHHQPIMLVVVLARLGLVRWLIEQG